MSTPTCSLCQSEDASEYFRVGPKCASRLGLRMMPPPQRPPVPCTRCNGLQFVRVLPRHYSTRTGVDGQLYQQHTTGAPLSLTAKPPDMRLRWLQQGDPIEQSELFDGLGIVEAYVCTKCGFVEWYCQNPREMPIGDEYNTQLVDYSSETPYR